MLAIVLLALAAPDLTLTWDGGEASSDASSSMTTWVVKDNVLTRSDIDSGRNHGMIPPNPPQKPLSLNAEQQTKVTELVAACDKVKRFKNDPPQRGRYTSIELTYGPKKKTMTLHYNYDVSVRILHEKDAPPDSPERSKAFEAVNALNMYFYSLISPF